MYEFEITETVMILKDEKSRKNTQKNWKRAQKSKRKNPKMSINILNETHLVMNFCQFLFDVTIVQ